MVSFIIRHHPKARSLQSLKKCLTNYNGDRHTALCLTLLNIHCKGSHLSRGRLVLSNLQSAPREVSRPVATPGARLHLVQLGFCCPPNIYGVAVLLAMSLSARVSNFRGQFACGAGAGASPTAWDPEKMQLTNMTLTRSEHNTFFVFGVDLTVSCRIIALKPKLNTATNWKKTECRDQCLHRRAQFSRTNTWLRQ